MGDERVVALPDSAASAGIAYDLPGVVRFRISSLAFELVAAAGAANRQVVAKLVDATGVPVFGVAAPAVQTAGQTVAYFFAPLVPTFGSAAVGFMGGPFVGHELPGNLTVAVTVVNAQAGDRISNGRLLVCQRLTDPAYDLSGS